MHLSEGIVSASVLAGGTAAAAAGLYIGIRELTPERIPRVAVLSSAFFVGSLVHIPAGPVSVHLVLNGINGLILGWTAFPSILVALTFQALMFQYGGITVLGINTLIMALPAMVSWFLFRRAVAGRSETLACAAGFGAGFLSVGLGGLLIAASLALSGEQFREASAVALAAHLPVMVAEGVFTALCVAFLRKVKPEVLGIAGSPRPGLQAEGG